MQPPPGTPRNVSIVQTVVRAETLLSEHELAAAVGITQARLMHLVHLGLVAPTGPEGSMFTPDSAVRLRRIFRLHHDLGVGLVSASIIVDLVERLDRLEAELDRRSWPGG